MSERPDHLYAPAIRIDGQVHAAPRPADDDVDGVNDMMHGDAIIHAWKTGKISRAKADSALLNPANMGFVTRSGKYLTRREAAEHVLTHNQFRNGNEKDSQLIKLKERLRRQLDAGHPETSLDSTDVNFFAKSEDPIVSPALRLADGRILTNPDNPDEGHWGVSSKAVYQDGVEKHHVEDALLRNPGGAGYVTRGGKYLTRPRALVHAIKHGQHELVANMAEARAYRKKAKAEGKTHLDGLGEGFLDSPEVRYAPLEKATFTERTNLKSDEFHAVELQVMHPDGKQGMAIHMMRDHKDPEGHWSIVNVDPVDETLSIDGHTHSRAFANRLGPAVVRQTVRHLKEKYGVKKVNGFRMTGVRFAGQPDDSDSIDKRDSQRISVDFGKSAAGQEPPYYIHTELDKQYDEGRLHSKRFRIVDSATGHRAQATLHRQSHHPEGEWKISFSAVPEDGGGFDRKHANKLGPATLRGFARFLKEKHGVEKVTGERVTGIRNPGHGPQGNDDGPMVSRDLAKAILNKYKDNQMAGELGHEMRFELNTRHKTPIVVHAHRYEGHKDGEYRVDIGPAHELYDRVEFDDHRYQNKVGVKRIRQVFRELKDHGVKTVESFRTSGARVAAHKSDLRVRKELAKAVAKFLYAKDRGDALQPWMIRKKRGPLKFNEDPIEIVRSEPSPMRDTFNAPVEKAWVDAGDKPSGQSPWKVTPFRPLMGGKKGVEHARISAPGNRGAVMSFKHNAKTGHTEIINFRAYEFHNDAFKAGMQAMKEGKHEADVDNIMEYHRSNVGVIGPSGVRAAARYLKEKYGSKTVGGVRVSGSRMNNKNDMPLAPTRRQGDLESLPGVKVKREITKAIDYEALDEEHEPRPKKAGGKGKPVGSRTDQARNQVSAFNATKKRVEQLKRDGKL